MPTGQFRPGRSANGTANIRRLSGCFTTPERWCRSIRGRPPKSVEQRYAEDNFNPTRHKTVPLLVAGRYRPACPKHRTGEARKSYRVLIDDLWDSCYQDAGDRLLVAANTMLHSVALSAQEVVDKVGPLYRVTRGVRHDTSGYKVIEANPVVKMLKDSVSELRQCCDLLGIGPSARARLRHPGMKGRSPVGILPGIGGKPVPITRDREMGERKVVEG